MGFAPGLPASRAVSSDDIAKQVNPSVGWTVAAVAGEMDLMSGVKLARVVPCLPAVYPTSLQVQRADVMRVRSQADDVMTVPCNSILLDFISTFL